MFERLLKDIANKLKHNKIEYAVIGGQALLIYGIVRMTNDIDITLSVDLNSLDKIMMIAEQLNLEPLVNNVEKFVKNTYVLPLIDKKSNIRVDFIFSWSLYEKEMIQRAQEVKIGKSKINFASLEDLIIQKIVSGREIDLEDIRNLLLKGLQIDKEYILKWLIEFEKTLNDKLVSQFKKLISNS